MNKIQNAYQRPKFTKHDFKSCTDGKWLSCQSSHIVLISLNTIFSLVLPCIQHFEGPLGLSYLISKIIICSLATKLLPPLPIQHVAKRTNVKNADNEI